MVYDMVHLSYDSLCQNVIVCKDTSMKRVPGNEYVWTFIAVYVVFYRLCVK